MLYVLYNVAPEVEIGCQSIHVISIVGRTTKIMYIREYEHKIRDYVLYTPLNSDVGSNHSPEALTIQHSWWISSKRLSCRLHWVYSGSNCSVFLQIVICVSQIYWTQEVHEAIRSGPHGLKEYHEKLTQQVSYGTNKHNCCNSYR